VTNSAHVGRLSMGARWVR